MRHTTLFQEDTTFVTHLECAATGERYPADKLINLSRTGQPLLVRYDLASLATALSKDDLIRRKPDLWRYREFLPVRRAENIVSLGEQLTPIIGASRLRRELGCGEILIKDEGRLPTGSFKARGITLAVSMAKELGVQEMAMASNGNAGAALAAYCSRAGMKSVVFCPLETPEINVREIALQGGRVYLVNGQINECGKLVTEGAKATGWFDVNTLKEPYRIEGKKTMGLELAEQLGWNVPDVILYPTGGGTGLIGMWKAFAELGEIGWLGSKRPRMVAVQASGCAPIVEAYESGATHASPWPNAHTIAAGIRVPAAIGDFLILQAVRDSGGFACAVDDAAIEQARTEVAHKEGLLLCPEGAATYAALKQELRSGRIATHETALLFNCGNGLKYPMPAVDNRLDRSQAIDYARL